MTEILDPWQALQQLAEIDPATVSRVTQVEGSKRKSTVTFRFFSLKKVQ